MATFQTRFRSISLPSRLHPIYPSNSGTEVEKLKSWQISSKSETIQSGLVRLVELYNSVQEIAQCSKSNQQSVVLHHHQDKNSMQESLSLSVDLLDACSSIRELVQMMRENVHALQSALRRKGLNSSIQNDINSYLYFRKKMNKCIAKNLKTLQNLKNKNETNDLTLSGDESVIRVLREVSGPTIDIFKSTLVFLSSPSINSSGWNLVSKLMFTKSAVSSRDNNVITEVGCVDFTLTKLQAWSLRNSDSKVLDKQILKISLQNLESGAGGIEAGLERLFRQLLQSRVTLLNIVTDH